jgi:hypothetical protein
VIGQRRHVETSLSHRLERLLRVAGPVREEAVVVEIGMYQTSIRHQH